MSRGYQSEFDGYRSEHRSFGGFWKLPRWTRLISNHGPTRPGARKGNRAPPPTTRPNLVFQIPTTFSHMKIHFTRKNVGSHSSKIAYFGVGPTCSKFKLRKLFKREILTFFKRPNYAVKFIEILSVIYQMKANALFFHMMPVTCHIEH